MGVGVGGERERKRSCVVFRVGIDTKVGFSFENEFFLFSSLFKFESVRRKDILQCLAECTFAQFSMRFKAEERRKQNEEKEEESAAAAVVVAGVDVSPRFSLSLSNLKKKKTQDRFRNCKSRNITKKRKTKKGIVRDWKLDQRG